MDDPVVAASAGSETETIGTDMQNPQRNSADEIAKFFDDIRSRQGIFSNQPSQNVIDGIDSSADENVKAAAEQYSCDYKPPMTLNKQNIYSINELILISKQLPEGHVEEIVFTLPKRKFWRLNHKQPEHGNQGKTMGHRGSNKGLNGSVSGKGFSGDDTNSLFEKKGNKGKYSRMTNGKRNGKFIKHERNGFMEEKDVTVNHDDLQALEEEFEPTGNSMADFESWKAKMKEMERRKKGLPAIEPSVSSKPSLSTTSSSISDFLGLNKIQNDTATNQPQLESIESEKGNSDDENGNLNKESHSDSAKGSYSRFSSFFTQSSSSSSLPTLGNTQESENPANKNSQNTLDDSTPNSRNPSVPGGSKLLSFFNKEASTPKGSRSQASLNTQDANPNPVNSSVVPPSQLHGQVPPQAPIRLPEQQLHQRSQHQHRHQQQQPQQRVLPPPSLPPSAMAPNQLQTNNAFFQNLLSKGELQNQKRNQPPGPPPGVMLPPGGQSSIPLGQQPPGIPPPQSGQPPAGMGMSAPFPMSMPPGPGAFPPRPPPGGHAGVPLGLQPPGTGHPAGKPRGSVGQPPMNDNSSNGAKGTSNSGGVNPRENAAGMQQSQALPLQPGMVPPQFIPGMAPPGFPMMPPNFNPMYVPPQGGLIPPPGGQGFFAPMPPPSGNMNFNAFPLQPPVFNQQHQEANNSESKK
ncbi:hypothetical protein ZYGR_0AV00800 [Zygosaccharomyces rouxii]|uniref:Uncharacterized protein n=1 Tax=Zygosaccharomyces rouxii TaxID=4956 RepID=A0A1Q3AI95_ZYGRO|nr:hypothetical protein ZYGR_0AV00800 [Zygosaccharomyces rouxii]